MRVTVDLPDDPLTAASVLCYLSDITLGTTALEPHGGRGGATGLQLGALELSLWFTRPAPMDQWLLFAFGTPFAGGGHALVQGVVHDADGDVVAMAVQNALMRWA
jgi:acyl-CoA thioesterase-2